jgi:RNase P subunit RPR2
MAHSKKRDVPLQPETIQETKALFPELLKAPTREFCKNCNKRLSLPGTNFCGRCRQGAKKP